MHAICKCKKCGETWTHRIVEHSGGGVLLSDRENYGCPECGSEDFDITGQEPFYDED